MCEHQTLNFWLADEQQTRQAGAALAAALVPVARTAPVVVFVRGDLGAGKSTLVRGFLTRAGIKGVMPSPTYSLVEPYQTDQLKIFHMDAYRLADAAELDYLGLDDIDAVGSILLVEWPDHIEDALPKPALTLDLRMCLRPDRHTPEAGLAQASTSVKASVEQAVKAAVELAVEEGQALPFAAKKGLDSQQKASNGLLGEGGTELADTAGTPVSGQVGRLLSVSTAAVPVQLRERVEASQEWRGLLRVVT